MPTTMMRAAVATEAGIGLHEMPRPVPSDEQVLVHVQAAGINRTDLGEAKAKPDAPLTVVGREWAGEIVQVGAKVKDLRPGMMVACLGYGGYAEYAVTDAGLAIPFDPHQVSVQQAAVLPLVTMTAHDALVTHGEVQTGQNVLVNGASSAVGLMLQQVARSKGAKLIAGTSRNPEHRERLGAFGATLAVDSSKPDWADVLLAATGNRGVDLTADLVGGATINGTMKATRVLGRIVNIGRLGGSHADFDLDMHAARRLTYVGVTFRTRSIEETRAIAAKMRADLWPDVVAGRITLPIDHVFKLEEAAAALAMMNANAQFGKLVLTL